MFNTPESESECYGFSTTKFFYAVPSVFTLLRMTAIVVLLKSNPETQILQHVYCLCKCHGSLNIMSVATVMVMKLIMNRMTATCRCALGVPGRNILNDRRASSKVNRCRSLLIVIIQVLLQHSLQL